MAHALRAQEEVWYGNFAVNLPARRLTVDGSGVNLARYEFELLRVLCLQRDRIVSFDHLCESLWGSTGARQRRRLNVTVFRLRLKLARSDPYRVELVRGRGYGLTAPMARVDGRDTPADDGRAVVSVPSSGPAAKLASPKRMT